ncbi:7847_t:CDS:2 [Dentiscutata erythropus]|uniref:7847_t:CDS:1 n=1 Tax=Dentiscutata erythropus TaxID=1348616 RepID=A0A9N9AX34_9GLOM|nr:7847_t:CDS:2 [Dentiscutata erythropus]
MIYSIDFFIRILNLSLFHPSFAILFLSFVYLQGYGYLSIKSRNGWKKSITDWDDEVVVITGDNIIYYECDVSKLEEVQKVAKEIIEEAGHPTILINNAGTVQGKTILESSEKEIIDTLNVNLLASFWTTKVFLPEMIKKNHGHIVTIASALGFIGMPQLGDYCASKAALISFHETLRLCPGKIKTGMFDGTTVRFPFLTPSMAALEIVKPIITALDKNQGQDILLPYYVNGLALLRFLPHFVQDLLYRSNGGPSSMLKWKGKYNNKDKDQ